MDTPASGIDIGAFVDSLVNDHKELGVRLRTVTHSVQSSNGSVGIHAHYLPFRQGVAEVDEFVDYLYMKLVGFCLHRKSIEQQQALWKDLPANKIQERANGLQLRAKRLFKTAQEKTNRNGEFGELIIYILIEAILGAPQFVAKMSLKTNTQMPVHGSDGIHLKWDEHKKRIVLYWGESKCHKTVNGAIDDAISSIAENLAASKLGQEVFLVQEYYDQSGFPEDMREAILAFLDPLDENYHQRADASVMLVCFDFKAFGEMSDVDEDNVEAEFEKQLTDALPKYVERIDEALETHGVKKHTIEMFFLPVPSVGDMRTKFQNIIGWKSAS